MTETNTNTNEIIDWNLFESQYVRFEEGIPVDLELINLQVTQEEFQGKLSPGLRAEVIRENGIPKKKELCVTSKRLALALRPIVENALQMENEVIKVRIRKTGSGFNTQYSVKEL